MNTSISIPVSTDLFLQLAEFLKGHNDPRDPVDVVSDAIDYWIQNADWKPELLVETDTRGYQWKSLFMPEGTQIRMPYKGSYAYAKVEGDEVIFKGNSTSPGRFANTVADSNRNAWRDLWIKRPSDEEWKLADNCRREVEKEVKKLLGKLDQP
jgi:hypothetical protein